MLVFYLVLFFIPLLFVKKRSDDEKRPIMDSYSTTCIKGILCFYVMLHNLGLDYKGNTELMELVCEHTGGIGVGVFFFLSAYGIIRAYYAKGNKYFQKLLLVNVVKLYLISVGINLLTYFVFFRDQIEGSDLFMRIFNLDVFNDFNRMNRHGWYISTIIGMYIIFVIVFYICSKLKTDKKFIIAGIILAFIAVMFRAGAWIADKGGMYTREMPCFAIGCIYATFYNQFNNFFKKHFNLSFIILFISFWVGFFFWEPLGAYATCLMLILVSTKFTYDNKVAFFFGKMCIGIYLFLHFSSLVMQKHLNNEYVWVISNALLIFGMSLGLYFIETIISEIIKKIKGACNKKIINNN